MTSGLFGTGGLPDRVDRIEGDRGAPDGLASPLLRRLLADWRSWRTGAHPPERAGFDIIRVGYIAGRLDLLDVEPAGAAGGRPTFRFRVHGAVSVAVLGDNLTGRGLGECRMRDPAGLLAGLLADAVASARAGALEGLLFDPRGTPFGWQVLALPLGDPYGRVNGMLLATDVAALPLAALRASAQRGLSGSARRV